MDETGITIQISDKVVTRKDYKQIESVVSTERENLVTMLYPQ